LNFSAHPASRKKNRNNTLIFVCESEIPPIVPLKLKIEINCREHLSVLGYQELPLQIESRWYSGNCRLTTFSLEELLGSKLRALYQRKKGRDLFDLWYCLSGKPLDDHAIITTFARLLEQDKLYISQKSFLENLNHKIHDSDFIGDITGLLRPSITFDVEKAWNLVAERLIRRLE
jgi:predicted nucleotidyltransferase component of viral defense system